MDNATVKGISSGKDNSQNNDRTIVDTAAAVLADVPPLAAGPFASQAATKYDTTSPPLCEAAPLPSRNSSETSHTVGESAEQAVREKPESISSHTKEEKDNHASTKSSVWNRFAKNKKTKDDKAVKISPEDDPDLKHFTPSQRRIILAQTEMGSEKRKIGYLDLYRFATKFELALNALGLVAAAGAGVITPLMTVFFGDLTAAFTSWGYAIAAGQDTGPAREILNAQVDKNVRLLCYIAIAMFGCCFIYMSTWIYTGQKIADRIRQEYLRAVLRQNVGWFDKLGAGEVTTRINTDTHSIQLGISEKVSVSIFNIATFIAGFAIAFSVNWKLTIVIATMVPAIMIVGALMSMSEAKLEKESLDCLGRGGTVAEETIASVRTVHAFGTQKKLVDLYEIPNLQAFAIGKKRSAYFGLGMASFFFIIFAGYALTFYWGTTLLLRNEATSGQVLTCFFSVLIGAFSLSLLSPNAAAIAGAAGAASTVVRTINRIPPIDSASPSGLKPTKVAGMITMQNIEFYYPSRPSIKVLDKVSLTFPPGKTSAIVGPSGGGKSSIIALLQRFYSPTSGTILLDGVEISDINVTWLRSHIGLVSQEPTLFSASVWENVAHGLINTAHQYADESQKRQLVIEACKTANAHGFVSSLPAGYDTQIGERGMLLSGGQKQRIAIARAVVSDPPILLLDEATSSLDTASEILVQEALDAASVGRTTVTIAHRLSTIRNADQIIVVNQGRVIEQGDHHTLLTQNGAYAALVNAQQLLHEQELTQAEESKLSELLAKEAEDAKKARVLTRADTSKSLASDILAQRQDIEAAIPGQKQLSIGTMMRRLLSHVGDLKYYYVLGFVASIVVGLVYPIFSIVFGLLLGVYSNPDPVEVRNGGNRNALYMLITAIVSASAMAIQSYTFAFTAQTLASRLRKKMLAKTVAQDISFFDDSKNSTGVLTSNISALPQSVSGACGLTLGTIVQSISTLVGGCVVGLAYSWRIALVGIALIPITLASGLGDFYAIQLRDKQVKAVHEASAQTACEAAAAIRTVAALTREDDAVRVYANALKAPLKRAARITLIGNLFYALAQSVLLGIVALMFWYGSQQLVDGKVSVSGFFIALEGVIFGSLQAGQVFVWAPDVSKASSAARSLLSLFDREIEVDAQSTEGLSPGIAEGSIVIKDVHFRYPTRPGVRVLRGLSMNIKPGSFVAICGSSGCGKSTIIQLIERFYDPLSGSIEVDGVDIRTLNIKAHREIISLVSQEPTLYEGSVRFNILLGATRDDVTQDEIEAACKAANIYDFITGLPDGFDTLVGGKGSQLSGGQKQRVAIARAIIRNPKILLLDESTSALDSQSEKVVQAALDAAAKNRTTIAIAHRLSTIQSADVIYVLKDGVIAEHGNHTELIRRRGYYYELVQHQNLEQ